MKLLALDTATERCSVALWVNGEVRQAAATEPRAHGRLVLPMVNELLAEAGLKLGGLDALAFGRGPGGFTGLRIAAGVVQGLGAGSGLPVVPVSDLAALAQQLLDDAAGARVLACMDARMNEFYWGTYAADEAGLAVPLAPERLTSAAAVQLAGDAWLVVGSGPAADPELAARLAASCDNLAGGAQAVSRLPEAAHIARLAVRDFEAGKAVPAEQARPVYLRDEVAWRT